MFFVIDRPQLQRIIAIIRDDRSLAAQGANVPFLRLAVVKDELTVGAASGEATIPATVYEPGVLFLRTTIFRRLLSSLKGEKHLTIQVTDSDLFMGNVKLPFEAADMELFSDPSNAPPHWPLSEQELQEWQLRRDYGWAIEIIHNRFNDGLARLCGERSLSQRYKNFQAKHDPIYYDLLAGMEDEPLAKTFVSYWTIGQTMATQSRFWLEMGVAEILIARYRKFEDASERYVMNQGLLRSAGPGLRELKGCVPVADMGEEHLEHLSGHRVWRPEMDADALEEIDVLVGEQERLPVEERQPFQPRTWTDEQNQEARELDRAHFQAVAKSLKGQRTSGVNLQCNLLVIEPYKVDGNIHARAFRFINPKTISSHAQRKQERVNLLRLYGLLVQEKIIRAPKSIHVCVAELVPRYGDFEQYDRYPDYFSPETYWTTDRLWDFIGVPFDAVTLAIRDAAKEFRKRLIEGLRGLLPEEELSGDAPLFDK